MTTTDPAPPAMTAAEFHAARRFADVGPNRIAYVERGAGPPALFLHGVPLTGFHWRHVMAALAGERRCIAPDLMGLGHTETAPGQDVSFTAQAGMLEGFLDALGIDRVDLVANDSGGAVAQIFAAKCPHRLSSLALTNCDVHDGWPPPQVLPLIEAARAGRLADRYELLSRDADEFRRCFADAYADPRSPTDEAIRVYLDPVLSSPHRRDAFHRYWGSFDASHTVAVEQGLRRLHAPTLVVWAMDDVFFGRDWANWLARTIPGAVGVVEVPGAKLFFPEDMPDRLVQPLRAFWAGHRGACESAGEGEVASPVASGLAVPVSPPSRPIRPLPA